jgi:hypothetical protein
MGPDRHVNNHVVSFYMGWMSVVAARRPLHTARGVAGNGDGSKKNAAEREGGVGGRL